MMQKYSQLLQIFGEPPFWRGQRLEAFSFSGLLLIGFGLDELVSLIIVISPVHLSTRMVTSRSSRHVRHVAPISPPFSARCAYFPSPRECTPSTVPKRSVISGLRNRQLFCLQAVAASFTSLCALFRTPFLCFQPFAASFAKTPGVGVGSPVCRGADLRSSCTKAPKTRICNPFVCHSYALILL